jgi:outer membrane protein insertion porin family
LSVNAATGWLWSPTLRTSAGPFDRDEPDTLDLYAHESGVSRLEQPSYLHADAGVTFDNRDHPSYPTGGSVARFSAATFRDRDRGTYSFDRVELEAAHFLSVAGDRGVIALHGWTVLSHTADDRVVPFYLMPGLGGHNTLRGYSDYRFHDRHLLVFNVESRWALLRHVDGAVFFDAGNVASRVGDLGFGRQSVGAGLRLHTAVSTLARFDVAHSAEGWRAMLRLSDPFRMSRHKSRTAPIPFVP